MEGFLLLDKPSGVTSHDVVDAVRRVTGERRVGHAGTLDPLATGLLLVAVGRPCTSQLSTFLGMDKTYEAEIRLNGTSETGDIDGNVTPLAEPLSEPTSAAVAETLRAFLGPQLQTPPMYSAKKLQGKKLYELARSGITVAREPVSITIHALDLISYAWPTLTVHATVSSGTYIRTLAEDMGKRLGVGGYLTALRRTAIGPYDVRNATKLSELTKSALSTVLLPKL